VLYASVASSWYSKLKWFISLFSLFLFISIASADEYVPTVNIELTDSSCIDFEGQLMPIELASLTGGHMVLAVRWAGEYKIVFDTAKYETLKDGYFYNVIRFAVYHECAHMRLGHLKHYDATVVSKTADLFSERNADCLAAVWMTKTEGKSRLITALHDLSTLRYITKHSSRYTNIIRCSGGI